MVDIEWTEIGQRVDRGWTKGGHRVDIEWTESGQRVDRGKTQGGNMVN